MTRTPTPAPSASPAPRGAWLWDRVRSVCLPGAPLLTLALLATPATAQIIPTGTPAADIVLTQALGEQRVFLTCSSLDAYSHGFIVEGWQRDVAAATATLTANAVAPEAIATFIEAASLENLLPDPDTPYSEVKELCDAYPLWQADYARLSFTILKLKLPRVFE